MFGHNDDDQQNNPVATVDPTASDSAPAPVPDSGLDLPAALTDDKPDDDTPVVPDISASAPVVTTPPAAKPDVSPDDLLKLKREALEELAPLVDHLQQSAEEKFKTTMMMIQATDDSSLVALAYQAAKDIPDDKVRAQALLDIVNEINYFTQNHAEAQ